MQHLLREQGLLKQRLAHYESLEVRMLLDQLRSSAKKVGSIHTVIQQVALPHVVALKQVALGLKTLSPCFVVLVTVIARQPHIAVVLSEDLARQWPQDAQAIVKELARLIQGGGGGNATFATAGGKQVAGLSRVLERAEHILKAHVKF